MKMVRFHGELVQFVEYLMLNPIHDITYYFPLKV